MPIRISKETLYIRHDFTDAERLEMATELAQAYNQKNAIEDEEKVMKTQIKERVAGVEAKVGSLSRKLNDAFEMQNRSCDLKYDFPNVGEVSYYDQDKLVKTRAMTETERQMDIPFDEKTVVVPAETSASNIQEFFGDKPSDGEAAPGTETEPETVTEDETDGDGPADSEKEYDPVANSVVEMESPQKNGPQLLAKYHEEQVAKENKKSGPKKKK